MEGIEVEGFGTVPVEGGESVARAIEKGGVDISHRCGGQAKCTTCRVVFHSPQPPMGEKERASLDEDGVLGQFRLSCQIDAEPGQRVSVLMRASEQGWTPGPELPR